MVLPSLQLHLEKKKGGGEGEELPRIYIYFTFDSLIYSSILLNITSSVRGKIPGLFFVPIIEKVLPELVTPYANISTFCPFKTSWIKGNVVLLKNACCDTVSVKILENLYLSGALFLVRYAFESYTKKNSISINLFFFKKKKFLLLQVGSLKLPDHLQREGMDHLNRFHNYLIAVEFLNKPIFF